MPQKLSKWWEEMGRAEQPPTATPIGELHLEMISQRLPLELSLSSVATRKLNATKLTHPRSFSLEYL